FQADDGIRVFHVTGVQTCALPIWYEGRVYAVGVGEEMWLVDRWILTGDPASEELRRKVGEKLQKQYTRADGVLMKVERWCWDSEIGRAACRGGGCRSEGRGRGREG